MKKLEKKHQKCLFVWLKCIYLYILMIIDYYLLKKNTKNMPRWNLLVFQISFKPKPSLLKGVPQWQNSSPSPEIDIIRAMETGNTSPCLSFSPPSVCPHAPLLPSDVHLLIIRCMMLSTAIMSLLMVIYVSYILWFTGRQCCCLFVVSVCKWFRLQTDLLKKKKNHKTLIIGCSDGENRWINLEKRHTELFYFVGVLIGQPWCVSDVSLLDVFAFPVHFQ